MNEGLRALLIVGVGVLIVVSITLVLLWLGVSFLPPQVPIGTI